MGVLNFFQKLVYFLLLRLFIPRCYFFADVYIHLYPPQYKQVAKKNVITSNFFSNASSSCLLVHMLGILECLVS